jgi:hypothetical protein
MHGVRTFGLVSRVGLEPKTYGLNIRGGRKLTGLDLARTLSRPAKGLLV